MYTYVYVYQVGGMEEGLDHRRELLELFGIDQDGGLYVLIAGIILIALTVLACCYCKVYDPLKAWTCKKYKKWRAKKPMDVQAPPPDAPLTPEVRIPASLFPLPSFPLSCICSFIVASAVVVRDLSRAMG